MGRADPAGGEDVSRSVPQRVQGGDDAGFLVGDDPNLLQAMAVLVRYSAINPMFFSLVGPDRISSPSPKYPP